MLLVESGDADLSRIRDGMPAATLKAAVALLLSTATILRTVLSGHPVDQQGTASLSAAGAGGAHCCTGGPGFVLHVGLLLVIDMLHPELLADPATRPEPTVAQHQPSDSDSWCTLAGTNPAGLAYLRGDGIQASLKQSTSALVKALALLAGDEALKAELLAQGGLVEAIQQLGICPHLQVSGHQLLGLANSMRH